MTGYIVTKKLEDGVLEVMIPHKLEAMNIWNVTKDLAKILKETVVTKGIEHKIEDSGFIQNRIKYIKVGKDFHTVIFDLKDVGQGQSVAAGFFITCLKMFNSIGLKFYLRGVSRETATTLKVLGLLEKFEILEERA